MSNTSLMYENGVITINGVAQILEITDKEAAVKLENKTLLIKGKGLNIVKLDKDKGAVVIESNDVSSFVYKQNGVNLKGLFK